jgi:hypothetical protein
MDWGERRKITDRSFVDHAPPLLAELFRYWDQRRAGRAMPARGDIGPEDFRRQLPGILLVDVEGEDEAGIGIFRYRLVGTGEVALRGHDPTGKLVQHGFFGPSLQDVLDCYETVRRDCTFLYDPLRYRTPEGKWADEHTLFLPLSEDGVSVSQILVYSETRVRKTGRA